YQLVVDRVLDRPEFLLGLAGLLLELHLGRDLRVEVGIEAILAFEPNRQPLLLDGDRPGLAIRTTLVLLGPFLTVAFLAHCAPLVVLPRNPHRGSPGPGERDVNRLFDPQPVQQALVATPVAADPDLEIEEHACAQLTLELGAGGRADLLD